MIRVEVKPELLRWARERAALDTSDLVQRLPQLPAWERGEVHPTLKQLEKFAKATHTPIGFLFLAEPPVEQVPIPDFRTIANKHLEHPTPDLLDTVYICQQRQEWYRDFMRSEREEPLPLSAPKTSRATSRRRPPASGARSASTSTSAAICRPGPKRFAASSRRRTSWACSS